MKTATKLQGFQSSNSSSGLSPEQRCAFQPESRGGVDSFCTLIILKFQDLFAKFLNSVLFIKSCVSLYLSLKIVEFNKQVRL